MNTETLLHPNPSRFPPDNICRGLRIGCVAWIAAMWFPAGIDAQTNAPQAAKPTKPPAYAFASEGETGNQGRRLYTMKFDGGTVEHLLAVLKDAFGEDNFLCTEGATKTRLPAFEIQRVTLTQLADSIDFLSNGALNIQVTDKNIGNNPANIWQFSAQADPTEFVSPKMKAIAAPHLFADDKVLTNFLWEAKNLRSEWLIPVEKEIERRRETEPGAFRITPPRVEIEPITSQKVIVLIGSEEGIAGMESFIKACEQRAADEKVNPDPAAGVDPKAAAQGAKATKREP